ncbi:MAG TPA: prenyltransferase/squalene oxidase repeat-containing protein [Blastocatellia bacterium]|nr:prenyltransferase/squalene oxidase repeat-containing protein [Blastocatellia bacterium]
MSIDRRTFLLNALGVASAAAFVNGCYRRQGSSPLKDAARYLWSQQAEDGGFHSTTYGLLRSGQSLTPFILVALLGVPESESSRPRGAVERALTFIKANTNAAGALGLMDDTAADYPNYATALAVCAMVKTRNPGYEKVIEPMVAQLRAQQFSEASGWTSEQAPYGGWGMGGSIHRPPEAGHVDLSMTRQVLEALQLSGVPPFDPVMTRALVYLQRSQNPDAGFYFSPVNPEINKAGESGGRFASYGTATADGVLALRAAGVPDEDPRVAKAINWLKDHHEADRAPGFDEGTGQPWGSGLRFYYAHAISRVLPNLSVELPPQSGDGSFRNSVNLVKEDDPLIATAFALYVMAR